MDNIRGRTIAITGAARGIGHATAKALLNRGARVVIGDRDVAVLESAVAGLAKFGQVTGYPLDVTDRESFEMFLDKARTDGDGHIDVLINNAGVMPVGPFLEQSEQSIRSSIEVNFYGVLTGCQLVLPEMVTRRRGHVVNIASMAGMVAVPGQVVYAGTKFAVVGLSTAMADEFAPAGRRGDVHPADVHQHRADLGHQEHRRAEARAARGHRRRDREVARQAEDPRVGARPAAVRRRRHLDARPARPALAVQADGQRPRLPGLRQDGAQGLRGPRPGRAAACSRSRARASRAL